MVQYLYANNIRGSLVDISDVAHGIREKYYCPSCGMEMSAVLGNKREHHFRHKGDSCSYESYLHKISKQLIKWRFDNDPKFEIGYYVNRNCPKSNCCLRDSGCNANEKELHRINIKDRYDVCEIEGTYNGFRADIKLSNSNKSEAVPMFIEIVVTHKCSPEKISLGVPIVEITVTNERDVLQPLIEQRKIDSRMPQQTNLFAPQTKEVKINFYNFDRIIYPGRQLSRFIIYKDSNDYLRGGIERCIGLCNKIIGQHNKIALFEFQVDNANLMNQLGNYLWYFGISLAVREGIKIRDCRICRNSNSCIMHVPTKRIDMRTKKQLFINVPIAKLNSKQFNTTCQANRCKNFIYNAQLMAQVLNHFKRLKYCVSRPYLSDSKD